MESPKRYHPVLVTLHWLIAVLVAIDLYLGFFQIAPSLRAGGGARVPQPIVTVHMAVGISIMVLILIRLFVRVRSGKPAPATSGSKAVDGFARLVHYALYFFVFAITVVGLVFAVQTNRLQRAFFGAGGSEFGGPRNGFGGFPTAGPGTPQPAFGPGNNPGQAGQPGGSPRFPGNGQRPGGARGGFGGAFFLLPVHLWIAILLLGLLAFHIVAALYHQVIRRDNLIARMWYGRA
jgi:cytochrome b561